MSLVTVTARGERRSLGRAHGEAAGPAIAGAVDFYIRHLEAGGGDVEALCARAAALVEAARPSAPGAVAEIEGMAESSGQDLALIALLNCLEEVEVAEACTTMISGRFLLHAEQWYAGHRGVAVMAAHPDDGPAFTSPTCAGFLPAVGMSASGFAQGIDSLAAYDERDGVPRVIVSREALGAEGIDGAAEAARMPGRAGGYAHVLMDAERSLTVETTAERAFVLESARAHTNHYLALQATAVAPRGSGGSLTRLRRARELTALDPPGSLDDCTRLLSDHVGEPESICLHEQGPSASATVFGMACDVATGVMIVSDGAPCEGRWSEFSVPDFRRPARVG